MNRYTISDPGDRKWAAVAHLSGLAGYLIPLGGLIAPILLMHSKKESVVVSSIARQALYLNIAVFLCLIPATLMFITLILIPISLLIYASVGIAAIALPVYGAIRSLDGLYFRYPVVGHDPIATDINRLSP